MFAISFSTSVNLPFIVTAHFSCCPFMGISICCRVFRQSITEPPVSSRILSPRILLASSILPFSSSQASLMACRFWDSVSKFMLFVSSWHAKAKLLLLEKLRKMWISKPRCSATNVRSRSRTPAPSSRPPDKAPFSPNGFRDLGFRL